MRILRPAKKLASVAGQLTTNTPLPSVLGSTRLIHVSKLHNCGFLLIRDTHLTNEECSECFEFANTLGASHSTVGTL